MAVTPRSIIRFWIDEVGPSGWYGGGPELDAAIRRRFGLAWRMARAGAFEDWQAAPSGTLALLILTDQFPRNIHRGRADAFATDPRARRIARRALQRGEDLQLPEPVREFVYLPFMHSERLADQDLSCRLYARRVPNLRRAKMPHALAHRSIVARFGRFPYRNDALGRSATPEEAAWLREVGYGGEVRAAGG
jgi:uncharacterized protein (DUF924 family)